MNIVIFAYNHRYLKPIMRYTSEHVRQIRTILPDAHIDIVDPQTQALDDYLANAEVLIISPLDHSGLIDFTKTPKLRWVHITAAGATDFAKRLQGTDILLTSSSGVHPIPIAEHVLTFMLMFARQFNVSYRAQIEHKKWTQEGIVPHLSELHGATIGIIGFGRIGQHIAKLAKGLDMHVTVLTHLKPATKNPPVDQFYKHEDRNDLLRQSDFVINCLPLTDETTNFFDKESFQYMKSTAYFINIGRGKTVVESDLIDALQAGTIAGAGLDVFEEEPLPEKSELWTLSNVILTPHYAGWTPRYIDRVTDIFCENLVAYLAGKKMPTLVDKTKGY
jgi:D-2-hydroxyacid dehydrogenase (NADP+)